MATEYHEHHINDTILRKIHAIRDKQRASMKRSGLTEQRFPYFPISKPVAKWVYETAGVKKPRPGWSVEVAEDHDDNVTWRLENIAGSYQLMPHYH